MKKELARSRKVIRKALARWKSGIACSFGKDTITLLHVALQQDSLVVDRIHVTSDTMFLTVGSRVYYYRVSSLSSIDVTMQTWCPTCTSGTLILDPPQDVVRARRPVHARDSLVGKRQAICRRLARRFE